MTDRAVTAHLQRDFARREAVTRTASRRIRTIAGEHRQALRAGLTTATVLAGLIALLFGWIPGPPIRADQFSLPKDLALGVFGSVCAARLLARGDVPSHDAIVLPLAGVAVWGAFLAAKVASNSDAAWRALGALGAGVAIFLFARRAGAESRRDELHYVICAAVAGVIILVLLEAYGGIAFISEPGRRPGGSLWNRNTVARLLCVLLPLMWRQMILANRAPSRTMLALMVALAAAVIVLSRSRGAWVVAATLAIVLPIASQVALGQLLPVHRSRATVRRWALAILLGCACAVLIPNRMGWRPTDLASSARTVFDYRAGTGRGRLIQAQTTWRMMRAEPWGVGPGNWSILYPAFASSEDPSYTPTAVYPAPRVPRGDVLSLTAELGLPGLLLGLLSALVVVARAAAMLGSSELRVRASGLLILAIVGAVVVLGLLDPVLRISPTLGIVSLLIGLAIADGDNSCWHGSRAKKLIGNGIITACGVGSLWFAVGAFRDIASFRLIRSVRTIDGLYRAVAVAPHNFEARITLAQILVAGRRCDLAEVQLQRASELQPFSTAPHVLRSACEGR